MSIKKIWLAIIMVFLLLVPFGMADASNTQTQVQILTAQVNSLTAQIKTLNAQITTKNSTISSLNAQIVAGNNTIKSLNTQIASQAATITALQAQIAQLQGGGTVNPIINSAPPAGALNVLQYGAKGNGIADDTAAIQSAITAASAAGGGTVYLPAGIYNVLSHNAFPMLGAINMANNVYLLLDANANIQQLHDGMAYSMVIDFEGCTNSGITGGTVTGNLATYDGQTAQGNTHGLYLGKSKNITIKNVNITANHGDGIWMGYSQTGGADNTDFTDGVVIEGCYITNCWRNGITFDSQKNVTVKDTTCAYNGRWQEAYVDPDDANPRSGIEFEPDNPECWVGTNILLDNVTCHHNGKVGFWIAAYFDNPAVLPCGIVVKNCSAYNNDTCGWSYIAAACNIRYGNLSLGSSPLRTITFSNCSPTPVNVEE
jgi:cell division protein FtsB